MTTRDDSAPAGPPVTGTAAAPARSGPTAAHKASMQALTLGAIGVVFGDIGTSPLYAIQTVFTADNHAVKPNQADVYGVISVVFWAVVLVVAVKYLTFILRADNGGEGGIMALTALIQKQPFSSTRAKVILITLGLIGASLFYGDGIITPAISVLSAVEGLKVAAPSLSSWVVPISLAILTVLFAIQRLGTAVVGKLFGPVMVVWFAILGAAGVREVLHTPQILRALLPSYGLSFVTGHGSVGFIALASVVLVITGAEALYADMGHFGPRPIRRAWFMLVFPALILNYLGQAALILRTPAAVENPFYLILPKWGQIPMVLLATVATVIASQAVVSGAFSVSRQAVQLGVLPPLSIRHTSTDEEGQVYVPAVNWALYAAVVVLVIGFGSSAGLASAYGVAVTGTFILNTVLYLAVVRVIWKKPWWLVALGAVGFLVVEIAFFTATLTKIAHGGWLPIVVALLVFTVLLTWQRGRGIVTANRTDKEGPLRAFVAELHAMDPPLHRVAGTAVFLNANDQTAPLALRANVEHSHVLHDSVVIVSIRFEKVPHISEDERLIIDDLGYRDDGILSITGKFGFSDEPDVPQLLRLATRSDLEVELDVDNASYYLSRMTITRTDKPGMAGWRKRLFLAFAHNAANPAEYFGLPIDRTVSLGAQIEI